MDSVGSSQGCIPNDEIIYVCNGTCEGNVGTGSFDAYYRVSDGPVPEAISECASSRIFNAVKSGQQKIIFSQKPGQKNLQLETFKVAQGDIAAWLSPYCKPAVYLYPKSQTFVNVKVESHLPLTYTLPLYPSGGWGVLADQNGLINYKNTFYDYLYYETKIPDGEVPKPQEGFVVKKGELKELFADILPKLGLNGKEERQFSEYWLDVLPESPYYFVGVVPQVDLNQLAQLAITPNPNTIIRVTLYFEALNSETNAKEPTILTPQRNGFTVVEWGGIFKRDKNHNFTCFQ
jgi:hypothetical protein